MGVEPWVFVATPEDPAARVCPRSFCGSLKKVSDLRSFFEKVDWVIFESEFIPPDTLREAARGLEVQFFPELASMEFLQDKLKQKSLLQRLRIPTARYYALKGTDLHAFREAWEHLGATKGVLKWAQLGYDGKGTLFVDGSAKSQQEAALFLSEAALRRVNVYLEERVDFKRELAVAACASADAFCAYPLVVSVQKQGICHHVMGPATAVGVKATLEKQAKAIAEKIAIATPLLGVFAIEFFESKSGKLLVNEIAPRVHNSAHYTQDAAVTDQFENHIRAAMGMELGITTTAPAFAMLNILGLSGVARAATLPEPGSNVFVHWYGKEEMRPGRKMGHLNAVGTKRGEIKKLLARLEQHLERWTKGKGV